MSLTPCPIGRAARVESDGSAAPAPCPVPLQPFHGRLTLGVARHLEVVHEVHPDDAMAEARRWVEAGCRAPR